MTLLVVPSWLMTPGAIYALKTEAAQSVMGRLSPLLPTEDELRQMPSHKRPGIAYADLWTPGRTRGDVTFALADREALVLYGVSFFGWPTSLREMGVRWRGDVVGLALLESLATYDRPVDTAFFSTALAAGPGGEVELRVDDPTVEYFVHGFVGRIVLHAIEILTRPVDTRTGTGPQP